MERVVVITGGTSGIGLELVKGFSENKDIVISISRNKETISNLKKEIKVEKIDFIDGDITSVADVEKLYLFIEKKYNKIDILINNAGIIHSGGIEELSFDNWKNMMDVNLNSVFNITQKMLPLLKNSDNGNIINISSISSKVIGSSIAYSSCKAGIDMFSKCLAKELSKYKIRVNTINPGLVETGFQVTNNIISSNQYGDFLLNAKKDYPFGIGKARYIADLALFLVSEKAEWITGGDFVIDGGRSINI